jgi:Family of unknown function (DUF6356)
MVKIFDATLDIVPIIHPISRGTVFTRLFLEHPRSVGESYLEHQRHALGFGLSLFLASMACFVHAIVPGMCVRTGSTAIKRLHDRMVTHRTAGNSSDALRARAQT